MKNTKKKSKSWIVIVVVLLILALLGMFFSGEDRVSGNVALIKVSGVISTTSGGFFDGVANSASIVNQIKKAEANKDIKGIMVEINSPGGSAVASEEISNALKQTNKPTVSYIRDAGASGGYWVASATDKIYASPLSIVGSVGVTAAQLEFAGLLSRYNITYRQLTAGEFKDIGTPFRTLTKEEEDRLQEKLDLMHQYFINQVQSSRNLSPEVLEEISKADFYVGIQAKEMGLIDDFGGENEARNYLREHIGEDVEVVDFAPEQGLFELLAGVLHFDSINLALDPTTPELR